MKKLAFVFVACFGLMGCALGQPYNETPKAAPLFDSIVRQSYYVRADLALACLDRHGFFTRDARACFVQGRGRCFYLTAPGDVSHDRELNAYCNGFRPSPPLELF